MVVSQQPNYFGEQLCGPCPCICVTWMQVRQYLAPLSTQLAWIRWWMGWVYLKQMSSGLTMYQCFQLVSFLSRNQQVDFELSFLTLQQLWCSLVSLVTPFNYSLNIQWCLFCTWTCLEWIDTTNKFQKYSANYLFTGACSSRTIWGKVHNKEQWKFRVLKETYSQNWEYVR